MALRAAYKRRAERRNGSDPTRHAETMAFKLKSCSQFMAHRRDCCRAVGSSSEQSSRYDQHCLRCQVAIPGRSGRRESIGSHCPSQEGSTTKFFRQLKRLRTERVCRAVGTIAKIGDFGSVGRTLVRETRAHDEHQLAIVTAVIAHHPPRSAHGSSRRRGEPQRAGRSNLA